MPTRRGMLPATRLLVDFLAERFALLDDPFRGPARESGPCDVV